MTNATCFSRDELRSYLLGELHERVSDEVASHVESCLDCEATVAELDRDSDTFVQSLRKPAQFEEPGSAYRLAVRQAVAQWPRTDDSKRASSVLTQQSRMLRDYELQEPLARGGMGAVYRARHQRLNRDVALKLLPGRWLQDAAVIARFQREMQAVGSLRHPAIVQATDGGEADGVHFLVMELIDGVDGGALVQLRGPLPIADACELVRQAAAGMAYVHQQGIIHRDLKPSNLMVTTSGEVKVLDLGLARIIGAQLAEDELTTVGQLMGTLDYMAPEQLENSHEVDERADIYALGATLYKLLTGRSPHAADAREPLLSRLRRIASDAPTPLPEVRSDVPAELAELVERMLARDVAQRPRTMESIAAALVPLAVSSDLAGRVREAERLRDEPPVDEALNSLAVPGILAAQPIKTVAPAADQRRRGGRSVVGIAVLLLFLAAAFGVVITLQTTSGQLVIETATPDVEVLVRKAGEPYRRLTLQQKASSLRLGAGEYEVEILGPADSLEIENGSYTLRRGETWVAKIVHSDDRGPGEDVISGASVASSIEPTYDGKTLEQWLAQLRRDRSTKSFYEAMQALELLVNGENADEAVAAVLAAVRHHDEGAFYRWDSSLGGGEQVWDSAHQFLSDLDLSVVSEAIAEELQRPEANTPFILYFLASHPEIYRVADERLLIHIERLAKDNLRALLLLQNMAPGFAEPYLRAALRDADPQRKLLSAKLLIEMESNIPAVVAVLQQIVSSSTEVHQRAQAAWLLGDLGPRAKPALPALIKLAQEDGFAVAEAAALSPNGEIGMVSVKDAAIRALAEIGDSSVVPLLVEEWKQRAFPERQPQQARPAWEQSTSRIVANTATESWIADAIEQLIGLRPTVQTQDDRQRAVIWTCNGLSLEEAYGQAFSSTPKSTPPEIIAAVEKLLPRANQSELFKARQWISIGAGAPIRADPELHLKLIALLAEYDAPENILSTIFSVVKSRTAFGSSVDSFGPEEAAAIGAPLQVAVQFVQSQENWKAELVPWLLSWSERTWPAGMVLLELLPELEEDQQATTIFTMLRALGAQGTEQMQMIGRHTRELEAPSEVIGRWLAVTDHQSVLYERLEREEGKPWLHLVLGLLRAGLAGDQVLEIVTERFAEDSIDRVELLVDLVRAVDERPDVAEFIVRLLRHPSLDEAASTVVNNGETTKESYRAYYLHKLRTVFAGLISDNRSEFKPLLEELVESGENGEPEAARQILQAWK